MKTMYIILIIIYSLSSCSSQRNDFFSLKQTEPLSITGRDKSKSYFKIVTKKDNAIISYPLDVSNFDEKTKIALIEELLGYEGNTNICSFPIMNYNNSLSQIYTGKLKEYSIQLEALFLINQVFFDKPFNYSPMPILINRTTKQEESENGDLVVTAYNDYKKWLEVIKDIGFEKVKKDKIYPLNKSDVSWLYGIGN